MKRLAILAKLMRQSVNEFLADNCPHLAAGISYYVLLSLFPLALVVISVADSILRSPDVEARVTQYIADSLPAAGDFVASTIRGVTRPWTWTAIGAMAMMGLIVTGLGVFNAMRKALNTAWGIRRPRPFYRERLLELGMMIVMAFLLLLSFGLVTLLNVNPSFRFPILGEQSPGGPFQNPVATLGSAVLAFATFLFLYRFVPNTRVRWRDVWPGALAAAAAFVVVSKIFIWFVGSFATYNLVYGSLGALIAFMTWVYISAVIMLFGAKLIAVYPRVMSSLRSEAFTEES